MIPQHSLPGGRYPLPGPDFHRLDRASFAWRTQTDSETWAKSGVPAETFRADFDGQALKLRNTSLIDDFLIAAYRDQAERARQYRLLRGEVSIDDWFEP